MILYPHCCKAGFEVLSLEHKKLYFLAQNNTIKASLPDVDDNVGFDVLGLGCIDDLADMALEEAAMVFVVIVFVGVVIVLIPLVGLVVVGVVFTGVVPVAIPLEDVVFVVIFEEEYVITLAFAEGVTMTLVLYCTAYCIVANNINVFKNS